MYLFVTYKVNSETIWRAMSQEYKYERATLNYKGARLSGFIRAMLGLIFVFKYNRASLNYKARDSQWLYCRYDGTDCYLYPYISSFVLCTVTATKINTTEFSHHAPVLSEWTSYSTCT